MPRPGNGAKEAVLELMRDGKIRMLRDIADALSNRFSANAVAVACSKLAQRGTLHRERVAGAYRYSLAKGLR